MASIAGLPFTKATYSLEKIAEEPTFHLFRQGVECPAMERANEKQTYVWILDSFESEFEILVLVDKISLMKLPELNKAPGLSLCHLFNYQ